MTFELTRRHISAIAKLDTAELGHSQRIDAIAKALGFATGATLMGRLKEDEATPEKQTGKLTAVVAFGSEMTSAIDNHEPLFDSLGDPIGGDLSLVEFDTKAEMDAYIQGANDVDGWMSWMVVADSADDPDHPIFAQLEKTPDVIKAYEAAFPSDEDDYEDEEDDEEI